MIDIDHHRGYILAVPKFYPGNRNKQSDDAYTVSANQAKFAFPSSRQSREYK